MVASAAPAAACRTGTGRLGTNRYNSTKARKLLEAGNAASSLPFRPSEVSTSLKRGSEMRYDDTASPVPSSSGPRVSTAQ